MSLAMIAVTMLYNIFLIVKIRYDKELITKITLRPYYCALAYLITICTEGVLKCYFALNDKVPKNDLNVWNNVDKDGLIATIRVFDSVNIVFFIYFVASRTQNAALLHQFMEFQSGYRIDQLDVVKDQF